MKTLLFCTQNKTPDFKVIRGHSGSRQSKKIRLSSDAANPSHFYDFTCKIHMSLRAGSSTSTPKVSPNRASPTFPHSLALQPRTASPTLTQHVPHRSSSHPASNHGLFITLKIASMRLLRSMQLIYRPWKHESIVHVLCTVSLIYLISRVVFEDIDQRWIIFLFNKLISRLNKIWRILDCCVWLKGHDFSV